MQPSAAARGGARRAFLAATAALSTLLTLVAALGMGLYLWTNDRIGHIGDESPVVSGSPAPSPAYTGRCAERSCNYLLLGSDSRQGLSKEELEHFGTDEDIGGENRADTIMVVHVEPGQQEATFLSFPRDLWVEIPGVGFGRINSAFQAGIERGGAQLVARTVRALTGIRIDHILYVNLAGFEDIVDALGGVQMCVPYPMQDELTGLDIGAGCQSFDGYTALAYVRTRHQPCDAIPDFARISRQQQFLRAVIAKLLSPSEIWRLPGLIDPVLDGLRVDEGLNAAELAYLAGQLQGVSSGAADFRVVPTVPGWEGELSIVRLVQPDADELFRRIRETRPLGDLGVTQVQTPPSPAVIATAVVDRRSLGAAATVLETLTQGGFNTAPGMLSVARLAGDVPVKGSAILFDPGAAQGEAMAEVVQGYLSNLDIVPATRDLLPEGVDVAVVTSAGYELPPPPSEAPTGGVDCPTA